MDKNKFGQIAAQIIMTCFLLIIVAGTMWLIFKMFGG